MRVYKKIRKQMITLCAIVAIVTISICENTVNTKASQSSSTTFAVLSTTNMHGSCWDTNLLNDTTVKNSLLRISSAVKALRTKYNGNIVLINSGDTFEGTPVSSYKITTANKKFTGEIPMAIGLKYIGYDVYSLGNQECSYSWKTMNKVYAYLKKSKIDVDGDGTKESCVPVISGNLVYKEKQGSHKAGELVFKPWTSKDIKVGDKTLKIGIFALENTEGARCDVTNKDSNISFTQRENASYNMQVEAQQYVKQMKDAGCDFIISSYHSRLDSESGLQALRVIKNTSGIDMMITSYDDSCGNLNGNRSNIYTNKKGNSVFVVNGGDNQLTKTQIVATAKKDGTFEITIPGEQTNVDLSKYKDDQVLKDLIKPYATEASNYLKEAGGKINDSKWDDNTNFYLKQTDTMDFINRAQMVVGTKYMKKKFASTCPVTLETLQKTYGNKYTLDVDCSCSNVATLGNYTVKAGALSMKDIYKMYPRDNSLCILPLTGAQMDKILEYVASKQLTYAISKGKTVFLTKGNKCDYPVFYGIDFSYDLSKKVGDRVTIRGFQNGKPFSLIQTYNLAIDNYLLSNGPFKKYGLDDTIWSQTEDLGVGGVRDLIKEFATGFGKKGVSPKRSDWKIEYGTVTN